MFKKILFLLLIASVSLTACGTLEISVDQTATPPVIKTVDHTAVPVDLPLSIDSTSEAIRQKMLRSALNWTTLWLDGTVTENLAATPEASRQQVWIDQPRGRFRFLSGPAAGTAVKFKVSDGFSMLEMDIPSGRTQILPVVQGMAGKFVPPFTPGMASPNLLGSQIGESFANLAFPSDYAQSEGLFKPISVELVAGRQALAVEWTYVNNSLPSWRVWLDVQTGVALKRQDFDKGGGEMVQREYTITQVVYDNPNLPDALFSVVPSEVPGFSDMSGAPESVATPGPEVPAGSDPLGDVYFFVLTPGDDANGARLGRLPGSCVVGKQSCPQVEFVPLPARTYANLGPVLAWSPNKKQVVFVSNPENDQTRLFIAAMPNPDWKEIAAFPMLDLPVWSGDAKWISFRVQDGNGGANYHVIHPDGSGMKNLTGSAQLPAAGEPYISDGWITNNLIVRSGRPGSESDVILLRADDARLTPLFDTFVTKALFHPSPDGSLLAFDDYNYETKTHILRVITPSGTGLRDLATFRTTISLITWSPDINDLAFAVYGEENPSQSAAYVISRDGRGLKQVYSGATIASLAFSPDGQFLLVENADQQRTFVVDLETLEAHPIAVPGLSLSDWQRQPVWVP